jgi:hypothetical protein
MKLAIWAALVCLAAPAVLHAEHFDIKLLAVGSDGVTREAYADQTPPIGGINPRPILKARVGDQIVVQFTMTNVYPHGVATNAGVHYFLVKENQIGQKSVPLLTHDAVVEGTFTFDLTPQGRIGARQQFVIRQPGAYLFRVESQRTQRNHEHFSAIDLQIQ